MGYFTNKMGQTSVLVIVMQIGKEKSQMENQPLATSSYLMVVLFQTAGSRARKILRNPNLNL